MSTTEITPQTGQGDILERAADIMREPQFPPSNPERLPAARRDEEERFWTGCSGERMTGEEVARHLESALAILDRGGWDRTFQYTDEIDAAKGLDKVLDDDSLSVKGIVKGLLRLVRDLLHEGPDRTLSGAMWRAREANLGDRDTGWVAGRCMDAVLSARSGSKRANYRPWSERVGRTQAEVMDLLTTAAAFARRYGPQS